jgi:PknH-like extracellular domain
VTIIGRVEVPSTIAAVSACVLLAGCSAPVDRAPAVRIVEAAKPSASVPAEQLLPTVDEMAVTLGIGGFLGQLVKGDADVLLQGAGEPEAMPVECVSTTHPLQKVVYRASPVRAVASQSWAGGDQGGPSVSGFFGVVKFATPDDAQAFFAASADRWRRCNGQTMALHQPQRRADGLSRITDVVVDSPIVSAVVLNDEGQTVQRALGLASDCVVDVEITDVGGGADTHGAVGVSNLMLKKVGVS